MLKENSVRLFMPSSADRLTSSALPSTFVRPSANSSEPVRTLPAHKASVSQNGASRLSLWQKTAAEGGDIGVGIATSFTGVLGHNNITTLHLLSFVLQNSFT